MSSEISSALDGSRIVRRARREGSMSPDFELSASYSATAFDREARSERRRASCADSESRRERFCRTSAGINSVSSSAGASISLSGASAGTSGADTAVLTTGAESPSSRAWPLSFEGLLVYLDSLSLVLRLLPPLLPPGLLEANPLGRSGCASKPNWTGVGGRSGSSFSASFVDGARPRRSTGCACFDICGSSCLL